LGKDTIQFIGSLDSHKNCIGVSGDGAGWIKFNTDATQLAGILRTFATFGESLIQITLRRME